MVNFLNSSFLYALPALAIPVLIHLMKRQIATPVIFPTIRFLTKDSLPHEGKRKLRDILLLILRLLIFLLIILTIAKPVWIEDSKADAAAPVVEQKKETVIVLDLSSSMGGWDNLTRAKQAINKLLEDTDQTVSMITFGDLSNITHKGTSAVEDALPELKVYPFEGILEAETLTKATQLFSENTSKTLYIVSDFQATNWAKASLSALPEGVELQLIDVSQGERGNVAVIDVETQDAANEQVSVRVDTKNFGNAPVTGIVVLKTDSTEVKQEITIPAHMVTTTTLLVPRPYDTEATVSFISDADKYSADNSYTFWIGRKPAISLLAYIPMKENPEKNEEFYYLQKALSAITQHTTTDFLVEFADMKKFGMLPIEDFDGILLLGAADLLKQHQFRELVRYVENGGLLFATPGNAPSSLFYNLNSNKLLTTNYLRLNKRSRRREAGLKSINSDSVLGSLFDDPTKTDLYTFLIRKYVTVAPRGTAETLITCDDDAPALLRQRFGKGATYALTFGLTPRWGDFQLSSTFVPILQQILSDPSVVDTLNINKVACGFTEGATRYDEPKALRIGAIPHEINISRNESDTMKQPLSVIRHMLKSQPVQQQSPSLSESDNQLPLWPYTGWLLAAIIICELLLGYFYDRSERRAA